jgi:hypothetical protein
MVLMFANPVNGSAPAATGSCFNLDLIAFD